MLAQRVGKYNASTQSSCLQRLCRRPPCVRALLRKFWPDDARDCVSDEQYCRDPRDDLLPGRRALLCPPNLAIQLYHVAPHLGTLGRLIRVVNMRF